MRIISAAGVSLQDLAAAFTASFSGYFYPMTLSAEQLARRVRFEHLDLQRSLLALEDAELVGMALLGLRGDRAWVGGLGITEKYRGRGLSHELMRALVSEARGFGSSLLTLEVLRQNQAAIRLYERAGMHIARELYIYARTADAPALSQVLPLREAGPDELLRHFHRLHLHAPAWQRTLASLLVMNGLRGLSLGEPDCPQAYALLRDWPDGTTYLVDLAAADNSSALALCDALHHVPGTLRLNNEPQNSIFNAPLSAHGFRKTERQYEMVMAL
ncbi:MAG TPA: GNAT family N-acetyltransferase [Pyrinomonadaceae bacterium]|jgi:RimJ/RimL family protein N-acetyltransferase